MKTLSILITIFLLGCTATQQPTVTKVDSPAKTENIEAEPQPDKNSKTEHVDDKWYDFWSDWDTEDTVETIIDIGIQILISPSPWD